MSANKKTKFTVIVHRGKDLAAKDKGGTSDPYLKIGTEPVLSGVSSSPGHPTKKFKKSPTIKKTLNPFWNYEWTFEINTDAVKDFGVRINVFDADLLSKDDFMGTTLLHLSHAPLNNKSIELEQDAEKKHRVEGSIIVSLKEKKEEPIDFKSCNECSDLFEAAKANHAGCLQSKVAQHALTEKDGSGNTPIHHACRFGGIDAVRYLIDHGVDINIPGHQDWSPIVVALAFGNLNIAEFLADKGAKFSPKGEGENQAFVTACQLGSLDSIQWMLRNGWNVNSRSVLDQSTGLNVAAFWGQPEVTAFLIECGANLEAKDKIGCTPLHKVCAKKTDGQTECCKLLISAGAKIGAKTNDGFTPLEVATNYSANRCIDLLKDAGAK